MVVFRRQRSGSSNTSASAATDSHEENISSRSFPLTSTSCQHDGGEYRRSIFPFQSGFVFRHSKRSYALLSCTALILYILFAGFSVEKKSIRQRNLQRHLAEAATIEDFSGGHNVKYAYRLGDVFVGYYMKKMPFHDMYEMYSTKYPGTLATLYLEKVQEEQYSYRNLTAFMEVLEEEEGDWYQHATDDELVVHLRLGDVLSDPQYTDVSVPVENVWRSYDGFVNEDGDVKSHYNEREFRILADRLGRERFRRCTIVGANFIDVKEHSYRNQDYLDLVSNFLAEEFKCQVSTYSSGNPDRDFMFLASARYLIAGMGGYAQLAAASVTARRGLNGNAVYDKFNGEVAGWVFPFQDRSLYFSSYIDWDLHRPGPMEGWE